MPVLPFTKHEKKLMMELAEQGIATHPRIPLSQIPQALQQNHGVFVTLFLDGELRGCIGRILTTQPLYKTIIQCAKEAAYDDPRFLPLAAAERKRIAIEISVLTSPVLLASRDQEHLLSKLTSEEGLIIKYHVTMATFLPQVWEQLPDKQAFLEALCYKAHLPPNTWQDSRAEIYVYKVEKIVTVNS